MRTVERNIFQPSTQYKQLSYKCCNQKERKHILGIATVKNTVSPHIQKGEERFFIIIIFMSLP